MNQNTPNSPSTQAAARARMLGEGIGELRDVNGVTIDELAATLAIDRELVERWEAGEVAPTFEEALAIEEALEADRGCLGAGGRYFSYAARPASNEQLIHSDEFDNSADAIEAVTAAAVLGLGVRLRNVMHCTDVSDDEVVTSEERWFVDVLGRPPADEEALD